MAKNGFFISLECMSDVSASATDKLIFAVLSTHSSQVEKDVRHSANMTAAKIFSVVSCLKDMRTVHKSLAALEKRGAIKPIRNGFHVFPWPVTGQEQEEQQDVREASPRPLPPGSPGEPWWLNAKSSEELLALLKKECPNGVTSAEVWDLASDAVMHHTNPWFLHLHTVIEEQLKAKGFAKDTRVKFN